MIPIKSLLHSDLTFHCLQDTKLLNPSIPLSNYCMKIKNLSLIEKVVLFSEVSIVLVLVLY